MTLKSGDRFQVCADPVFIIGSPRSGLTALGRSLNRHSDLWYSRPTRLFALLYGNMRLGHVYESEVAKDGWLKRQQVTRDDFLQSMGTGLNILLTSRSGAKRWVDTLQHSTSMVDLVAEVYPGARFIHVLRDGRRVVESMMHFQSVRRWSDIRVASNEWKADVESAMNFAARHPDRCMTVRNEDLVRVPQETFSRIFSFLAVSPQPGPVSFIRNRRVKSSFADESRDLLTDPWSGWTREQKRIFLEEAGAVMVRFHLVTVDDLDLLEKDAGVSRRR